MGTVVPNTPAPTFAVPLRVSSYNTSLNATEYVAVASPRMVSQEARSFPQRPQLLCERSGVEVPAILGDILRWLAAHALAQPDVFAQQPRSAATSHLKSALDSGISLAELVEGTHPAVVGSLLKRWLEELPDPLLNWDQQVELLSACKDEGCIEARIASLNDAVALVDPVSQGTLKPLLLFLQQYCFRQRRFDQQLLQVAVAFAPILFPAALAAGPAELRLAEETVATLVSNALHVFNPTLAANVPVVTPQALCEAAAEVTAMESSQDQQQPLSVQHDISQADAVDCAKASSLQRRRSGGGGDVHSCEHVDDVALLSVDQHLVQRRAPHQEAAARKKAPELECVPTAVDVLQQESLYEPYMTDATFLASFSWLVDTCVGSALFCGSDGSDGGAVELGTPGAGAVEIAASEPDIKERRCTSVASVSSSVRLSSSSGGSINGSGRGASTTNREMDSRHELQCSSLDLQKHQIHTRKGVQSGVSNVPQVPHDGEVEAPYSPRAVLVTSPRPDQLDQGGKILAAQPAIILSHGDGGGGPKADMTSTAAAALAELAHREVSEGSVFCIISAQPGGISTVMPDRAPGHVLRAQQTTSGNHAKVHHVSTLPASQQQQEAAGAKLASAVRRPTGRGTSSTQESTQQPHQQQAVSEASSRQSPGESSCTAAGEVLHRRMTMGGGDSTHVDGGGDTQPAQRQATGPTGPSRCSAGEQQQQPQSSSRQRSGMDIATRHAPDSNVRDSCSQLHSHPHHQHALPPAAATSVAAALHGGSSSIHVAELGVAGHLRVSLSSAHTLVVRELSTPEALAHRVPIRSLSVSALQNEKERLKRQLKDVAATYEALAGRPLVPALKEPLRPVYVRYHKIKALLNGGRQGVAAQTKDGQQLGSGRGGGAGKHAPAASSSRHVTVT